MKGFRKIFVKILSIVILLVSITGCSAEQPMYEEKLLNIGKEALESWEVVPGRHYNVVKKNGRYNVNINGDVYIIEQISAQEDKPLIREVEAPNPQVQKVYDTSLAMVKSYVNESTILKEKETINEKLSNLELKIAEMGEIVALYKDGAVYVGKNHLDVVCEWMICHELVHAIAEITNGGVENEPYAYNILNEVLTDIITSTLDPQMTQGYSSGYAKYYDFILLYIGCFEEKAFEAYYYGYHELWETVGKDEFDIWVFSLEQLNNELGLVCANNFLNKWGESK